MQQQVVSSKRMEIFAVNWLNLLFSTKVTASGHWSHIIPSAAKFAANLSPNRL
jgi:hypothetical protein